MAHVSHVLARKYRPQTFNDLIGQDVLVRTITNAIEANRLAHAYMLTGIRGIGKTTSARIIAMGLNCIGEDGKGGMTPNPCGKCKHCVDIMNDAHIDVVEIDAASNTGVDNVRDVIIEGAKYNPVSARFKIYIIDEVHMLSKPAFNALLKTLEEPPAHVKFIFATTEIRKVPVTILSRCQRFDLKRLDEPTLVNHLAKITLKEDAKAEQTALQLIAKAGDGSVRDALSLLDQAITHFDGDIKAEQVRQMLGLADKTVLFELYENVMAGNVAKTLELVQEQYESGADPIVIATDLLDLTHWLTRIKITPDLIKDVTISDVERALGQKMADGLSMAGLTRAWQMLLKGLYEIKNADQPVKALEMVLIRLAYATDLPMPKDVLEDLKKNTEIVSVSRPIEKNVAKKEVVVPAVKKESLFKTVADITALAREKQQRMLAFNMEKFIRPIELDGIRFRCSLTNEAPHDMIPSLIKFLKDQTGDDWDVIVEENGGGQTAKEVQEVETQKQLDNIQKDPVVASVLAAFKGAKIDKFRVEKTEDVSPADDVIPESVN